MDSVTGNPEQPGDPDDEVDFWRGFIEWWARERDGPVPQRAWAALSDAEDRAGRRGEGPGGPQHAS